MARAVGLAWTRLLHAMRCPDLASEAVLWVLMEARLTMAGTEGRPHPGLRDSGGGAHGGGRTSPSEPPGWRATRQRVLPTGPVGAASTEAGFPPWAMWPGGCGLRAGEAVSLQLWEFSV